MAKRAERTAEPRCGVKSVRPRMQEAWAKQTAVCCRAPDKAINAALADPKIIARLIDRRGRKRTCGQITRPQAASEIHTIQKTVTQRARGVFIFMAQVDAEWDAGRRLPFLGLFQRWQHS